MKRTIWAGCAVVLLKLLIAAWAPPIHSAVERAVFAATFGERYLVYELLGGVLVFVALRLGWREWGKAGFYAALIGALYLEAPASARLSAILFAGTALAGIGTMFVLAERALVTRKRRDLELAAVVMLLPAFRALRLAMLGLTPSVLPETHDLRLYLFDASLGTQFSFLAGQLFRAVPWLGWISSRAYYAMPLAIAALYAVWLPRRERPAVNIVAIAVVMGMAGYACYCVFPACGPAFQFGAAFPNSPPAAEKFSGAALSLALPAAPRNAMPSLHMAWALMVFLNTRRLGRLIRAAAALFLFLTMLATLGLGEHYLIDLVVAFPFTAAAQGAFNRRVAWRHPARLGAVAWGIFATAAWLVFLRFGLALYRGDHLLAWSLALLTAGVSVVLERRLAIAKPMEKAVPEASGVNVRVSGPAFLPAPSITGNRNANLSR